MSFVHSLTAILGRRAPSGVSRNVAPVFRHFQATPSLRYEVLVPYHDPRLSERNGQPHDTRQSLVFNVWARDEMDALRCARERFEDHRRGKSRTARMAPEGPVALRVARSAT